MTFEILMAVSVMAMAALGLLHSLLTRSRGEAIMLFTVGVTFGYVFPLIDINVFHHYTFHGQLTVMNIPFYLGFAWYGFYYLALVLAEMILGQNKGRLRISLLAALIFGVLEAQWDPTLIAVGKIEMFLPSFATWPNKFHCGVPMFHAFLGFVFVYGFLVLRDTQKPIISTAAILTVLLGTSLSMMASVPRMVPIFEYFKVRCSQGVLIVLDASHFLSTFVAVGALAAWMLRIVGRRLGDGASVR